MEKKRSKTTTRSSTYLRLVAVYTDVRFGSVAKDGLEEPLCSTDVFLHHSSTARVGFKVRGASVLLWSISREYQQLVSSSVLGESTSFVGSMGVVRLSLLLNSFSDSFVLNMNTAGSALVGPSSGFLGLAELSGGPEWRQQNEETEWGRGRVLLWPRDVGDFGLKRSWLCS